MKTKKNVIVVGGGASGMAAAVCAARLGAHVTILEKNPRVGKKILATGNGRCNFTNINTQLACYRGKDPGFARSALESFGAQAAIGFFEELGIEHKVEDAGKVFPMSDQASSILDVLMYELQALGVHTICESKVVGIKKKNALFAVELENGQVYQADSVILAAGGKAMPSSGSDGDGYELARGLGHTLTDVFPALVQLMLEGTFFKRIEGVKFVGTAEILYNGQSLEKDSGDILFANYGVSGPPILQISRKAGELLNAGKQAQLKITLIDSLSKAELRQRLDRRFRQGAEKPADFSLVGLINKRLIPVLLMEAGIRDIKTPAAKLSGKEREAILDILTDWRFQIKGTKNWLSAQVTAGGVDTAEINPDTMESKRVGGLFFAGEIIDIDGRCGGYNLQWAWSSGFTAGQCAAQ